MKYCKPERRVSREMSGGGDPLDPVGWAIWGGRANKGVTESRGRNAAFKHNQALRHGDVWRMNVQKVW
jgi:hypothetical protein